MMTDLYVHSFFFFLKVYYYLEQLFFIPHLLIGIKLVLMTAFCEQ